MALGLANRHLSLGDSKKRCGVLIVGAGLSGLSTAYHLEKAGHRDYLILEAEDRPGGWAKTDWSGEWGADRAIHVLYFRSAEVRQWVQTLLDGEWREHKKRCVVDSHGVRTPFPFHANLNGRAPEVVFESLLGLWQASIERGKGDRRPESFADWIALTGGSGVAKHFMNPYNEKMWTVPPSDMGWDWIGDFIPQPEPDRILKGALGAADSELGPNASFFYASRGASSLADALAAQVQPIRFGTRLVALDPAKHLATLSDGSQVEYQTLVSTMPLTALGGMLGPLPPPVEATLRRLESIDLVLVDVGFANPETFDVHWTYFPDADVLAYRLHVVHALSSEMMPAEHGLYCLEISHSRHRPLPPGELRRRVIDDLVRTGWLRAAEQVRFYRERRFPCSYVIPRIGFRRDADALRAHARAWDIHSIGRFGEWKYSNQEDALLDGRRAAELIVGTAPGVAPAAPTMAR